MLNDSRQNFSFNENLKDEWERLADLGLVIYSAVVVVAGWDLVVLQYPLESSFLGVIGAIALFTLIYFATRWLEMFELLLTESKIRQKLLVVSIFIVSLLLVFNWL